MNRREPSWRKSPAPRSSNPSVSIPVPPVLEPAIPAAAAASPRPLARWRLFVALGLLVAYVTVPAVLGLAHEGSEEAILPSQVSGVLTLCAFELSLFAAVFAAAWGFARFQRTDLLLAWTGGWRTWPRSLGWSLALRFVVGGMLIGAIAIAHLVSGQPLEQFKEVRPKVEAMVDAQALQDPLYLALMLTLVSFVLAGLREELWRIAMVSLLGRLAPSWFGQRWGPWLALVPVAVLFGLGHTAQGIAGVAATTALGLGLGAIMLYHRSLWDAVLAHGFFNATTFALLPWLADLLPKLSNSP